MINTNLNHIRHIVLDTETTGFRSNEGDRLVEIGCIELINHVPSGANYYHSYLNPERNMPDAAYQVHKLSSEFLADKPLFIDVVDAFLEFIGDSPLIIHNAEFDMGFINAELKRIGRKPLDHTRCIDTLMIARKKFPNMNNKLDALCDRFKIDRNKRNDAHGAIIDCELLSEVYLELIGGKQQNLGLDSQNDPQHDSLLALNAGSSSYSDPSFYQNRKPAELSPISAEEQAQHVEILNRIKSPIWK